MHAEKLFRHHKTQNAVAQKLHTFKGGWQPVIVELPVQIGFVGEGGLEQGEVVEVVIKTFLQGAQALFPFGINLRLAVAVKVLQDLGDDLFQFLAHTQLKKLPPVPRLSAGVYNLAV